MPFVRSEHPNRLTRDLLDGSADLVIEVISDENTTRDRSDKVDAYQDGGVPENWVIDARAGQERVDFWVLDATGRYRPALPSDYGTYRFGVLSDFRFAVEWLWQPDLDA